MPEWITPRQFHEAEGIEDWRVLANGVSAYFSTGSFATGVELVDMIGQLADVANHHPDVDVRYSGVTVRLMGDDVNGMSQRDVELARQISAAARELRVPADPTAVQDVQLTIDALVAPEVRPFWRAVLGYREAGDSSSLRTLMTPVRVFGMVALSFIGPSTTVTVVFGPLNRWIFESQTPFDDETQGPPTKLVCSLGQRGRRSA